MTEYKLKVYGDYTECRNQDGKRHRLENDGPAIEWSNGTKLWYINGVRHRENGPAIEYANGSKSWWINGHRHRIDGPAVEWANGDKSWYINGKLNRIDGPAIEYSNGSKSWYINGKKYSEQSFNEYINNQNKPCLGKKVIVDGIEYELR